MSREPARAVRTRRVVEELWEQCRRASASLEQALPQSNDDGDPYLRAIFFALAHEMTFLEDEIHSIYPRLWHQIGSQLCPEILQTTPSRLVVRLSSAAPCSVSAGRPLYAVGPSARREGYSFLTDTAVDVIPLHWSGGYVEGDTAYLRAEMPRGAERFPFRGALRLYLDRTRTRLTPEMSRSLPQTRVSYFDGEEFRSVGPLSPVKNPAQTFYAQQPLLPAENDYYFFEIEALDGWSSGRWKGKDGYWLKMEFQNAPAEMVVPDLNRIPFEFNCCTASNLRRDHLNLPLDPEGIAFARVGPIVEGELLVGVESVEVGSRKLNPAHETVEGAWGTYVLDWKRSPVAKFTPQYDLLLHVRSAPGATVAAMTADVTVLATEPDLKPKIEKGAINQNFRPDNGQSNVTATNVTQPWPGKLGVQMTPQIVEGIGHVVRTGDRLTTRRDFEHVLRRLDERIGAVSVQPVLEPDHAGTLHQFFDVTVRVKDWSGPVGWGQAILASFYQKELEQRVPPNINVRVSCEVETR